MFDRPKKDHLRPRVGDVPKWPENRPFLRPNPTTFIANAGYRFADPSEAMCSLNLDFAVSVKWA
jgi:hypothetical protein